MFNKELKEDLVVERSSKSVPLWVAGLLGSLVLALAAALIWVLVDLRRKRHHCVPQQLEMEEQELEEHEQLVQELSVCSLAAAYCQS